MFAEGEELLDLLDIDIEYIEESRKYWLVRTDSGVFYNDFINGGYISIGWNEFNNENDFIDKKMSEGIKEHILSYYPEKQPGRIYSQIRKFIYDINIGDVVMIPSENSKEISFGIVQGELYKRDVNDDSFIKSKRVHWVKNVARDSLDPYLFKMMQAHMAVNNADEYAHYIDRTMYSLYSKGQDSFLILPVKRESDIPAYDLSKFISSLVETVILVNELEKDNNLYDIRDLDIKLNIQSPGFVELMSSAKDLVIKIVTVIKHAITTNQVLSEELLSKTDPVKLQLLEQQSEKIKQSFEEVKATLPEDIKKRI